MQGSDLIEIQVSRLISAEKWRIMRLLTRVQDFPSFVSTVKEAVVIQKQRNRITTRWHIQLDTIPIRWVEEDILDLSQNKIYFKAIEGDLTTFSGTWIIEPRQDGNLVTVIVHLGVAIPGIQEFAQEYLRKIVTRNFEAILEAMDEHLVSMRYASVRLGNIDKVAGFGIIGHLYNYYHLEKALKLLNPSFQMPSREFLSQLFHVTPSFKLFDIPQYRSAHGETTKGVFIVATFIPDMIDRDMWAVFSKVVLACKIAEKSGIGIVTLGGFTSIVAERIGHEVSQEVDVSVTTGNTFTAAMTIDGVLKAAQRMNLDLDKAHLVVVGGTGDIGCACSRVFAHQVRQLTITGRTRSNLQLIRAELSKVRKARIDATTENEAAVRKADIVIAATSATSAILPIDWFKPGAIICDVGYPKSISYAPTERKDIFIFSGGLTKAPMPLQIPISLGLPSPQAMYGCFAESIILALEKRYENYSFGRGNITPEKIDEIRGLGLKHGFEVADFYWGDATIDEPSVARVSEAIRENKTHCAGT